MLSFVKINDTGGIWANKDDALDFLKAGYSVYKDETCAEEMTEEMINAIEVTTGGSPSASTSHTVTVEEILAQLSINNEED